MKRQIYQLQQNILASREKILLGSNITTIQFLQGSFKEMPTCEYYFVNQDRSAPGLLCQGQAEKPSIRSK